MVGGGQKYHGDLVSDSVTLIGYLNFCLEDERIKVGHIITDRFFFF